MVFFMCKENCSECLEDKSCCNGIYHTLDEDTFHRLLEPCDEFYDVIEYGDL